MKLFHGTTADALPSILKNGLLIDKGGENWSVSGNAVYFWSPKHLENHSECNEGDGENYAQRQAEGNGQVGLGFAKDCRLVIIEVDLHESEIEEDHSCPSMAGAVCITEDVALDRITSIRVSQDLSLFKGYFLSGHLHRNLSARTLTDMERKVAGVFAKSDSFYFEDEIELEWEPVAF